MPATRELRRRIKSVKSTKQITKAMELVSSAKVRRASQATLSSRPYADRLDELLQDLLQRGRNGYHHPLLQARPVKTVLVITIASDRGLAGVYNAALLKKALQFVSEQKK
ncbi:F0F1 ATP synthase subunit gamma, partial [Patescibacteria group bacterium]|nr:F0F1 ATP synthase subunit gamma [Patescibacteria group bacterium]